MAGMGGRWRRRGDRRGRSWWVVVGGKGNWQFFDTLDVPSKVWHGCSDACRDISPGPDALTRSGPPRGDLR
jgi:hypothetical protein